MKLISALNQEWELELETNKGTPIPNSLRRLPVEAIDVATKKAAFTEKYKQKIQIRDEVGSHVYNCHGLVFAGRRTRITEGPLVDLILKEDRYVAIKAHEALPGDIVAYRNSVKNLVEHTGIVVEAAKKDEGMPMPTIVSKWAHLFEVVHRVWDCPYAYDEYEPIVVEYYRCRLIS